MQTRVRSLAAALLALSLLIPASTQAAAPSAGAIATDKIKDMTATIRVVDADFDELKKIGGAFATTYRFKTMNIAYKNPNKTRLETKVAGLSATLVFNGPMKMYKVPFKKDVKNVEKEPGQKQSMLHFGIFTKDFLETDYSAAYIRTDRGLQVYKLSQRNTDNKSHEVVWVNPKTAIIERRQAFNGDNILRNETRYKNPVEIRPGIWIPTRIEVYNQFGKLSATQAVENIKVNLGVGDDTFSLS